MKKSVLVFFTILLLSACSVSKEKSCLDEYGYSKDQFNSDISSAIDNIEDNYKNGLIDKDTKKAQLNILENIKFDEKTACMFAERNIK